MLDDDPGSVMMPGSLNFDCLSTGNKLLGLMDYYEVIFGCEGLIEKESEFRANKLSLILDLINAIQIPEELTSDLRSAIIAAWQLKIPGGTREQRMQEISIVLHCIDRIRSSVRWAKEHPSPVLGLELDVAVLHSLPLRSSDMDRNDVPKVLDLLSLAVEHLEGLIEGSILCLERDEAFSAINRADEFKRL